jgi:hypothetical protein
MASRQQSIKVKIILLLVVPLAALLVLWVFAASGSFGDTVLLVKAKSFDTKLIRPTQGLVDQLEQERRLSLAALGAGHEADRSGLTSQRSQTNAARGTFQHDIRDSGLRRGLPSALKEQMDGLSRRLNELNGLRAAVDVTSVTRDAVFSEFNSLIDDAFTMYASVSTSNAQIAGEVRTLTALSRAREVLSREDALVTGVLSAHRVTSLERDSIAELVGSQRFEYAETVPELDPADRGSFQSYLDSMEFQRFQALEDSLVRSDGKNGRPTVRLETWDAAAPTVMTSLRGLELVAIDGTTGRARGIAVSVLIRLAVTGGLGLIAIIASVIIAIRISRRVIGEVRALAGSVESFTTERLPRLAERVRQGEPIDENDAALELNFSVTEIDRLSDAFDDARSAVVAAARSEAAARKGVSEVFVNLARRNQALLHRQLGLLDLMERRVEDPQELDELFRLDHLATCMRRHAEGLVILAGRTAGRSWRTPVPLIDVVRGAVAEVEDYTRVRVMPMPRTALTGTAVADTIHLLAELIENAAMFSPPQAPVQVSGRAVSSGFVVEIEDRGLGMTPELLAELNGRLAEAPEFDLFDSARLGIFVVARLANRHDVRVLLRPSPYGGTTAVVLIPATLIVSEKRTVPAPMAGAAQTPKPLAMAPEPVEVIDAADSTMPSLILGAARRPEDGDRTPTGPALAGGMAASRTAAGRTFGTGTSPAPAGSGFVDGVPPGRTSGGLNPMGPVPSGGVPPSRTPADSAPLAGVPASRTPVSESATGRTAGAGPGERPEAEPDTYLGMPRRRRQTGQAAGQTAGAHGEPAGGTAGADGSGTHLGMPRRTRQASLAPQLRSDSREPTDDEVKSDSGSDRSPDDLRARMAAMQSGWQRGRTVAEPSDPGAEQTAGRTSEVPARPAVRPAKEEDTP